MELSKQVCSLEISKKLKEMGMKQDGIYVYLHVPEKINQYTHRKEHWKLIPEKVTRGGFSNTVSAFSVAELGEMLPKVLTWEGKKYWINFGYFHGVPTVIYDIDEPKWERLLVVEGDTEADARGRTLIHLIEDNYITLTPSTK